MLPQPFLDLRTLGPDDTMVRPHCLGVCLSVGVGDIMRGVRFFPERGAEGDVSFRVVILSQLHQDNPTE